VKVVLDRKRAMSDLEAITRLIKAGVLVRLHDGLRSSKRSAMHDKMILVDSLHRISGSSNTGWTADQESAEDLLVLHATDVPLLVPLFFEKPHRRFRYLWDNASNLESQ
jgi:phosphatidylserine/phosphatidylglycerophosphate/cardiolipin synthase-like enzyme